MTERKEHKGRYWNQCSLYFSTLYSSLLFSTHLYSFLFISILSFFFHFSFDFLPFFGFGAPRHWSPGRIGPTKFRAAPLWLCSRPGFYRCRGLQRWSPHRTDVGSHAVEVQSMESCWVLSLRNGWFLRTSSCLSDRKLNCEWDAYINYVATFVKCKSKWILGKSRCY